MRCVELFFFSTAFVVVVAVGAPTLSVRCQLRAKFEKGAKLKQTVYFGFVVPIFIRLSRARVSFESRDAGAAQQQQLSETRNLTKAERKRARTSSAQPRPS